MLKNEAQAGKRVLPDGLLAPTGAHFFVLAAMMVLNRRLATSNFPPDLVENDKRN